MKKTRNDKTGFHDWLLINALKYQGDNTIPDGFTVSDEKRRETVLHDSEAKLNLLAEVAKKKFSEWTIVVFSVTFGLSIFIVAYILFSLYWKFSGGTLPGSTEMEGDDKFVNVGPFLLFLYYQYVFLFVTLLLTLLAQPIMEGYRLVMRMLGKTEQHDRWSSPVFSALIYLSSLIGTIIFALQWVSVKVVSFLTATIWKKNLSIEYLFDQFRDKPHLRGAIAGLLTNSLWILPALFIVGTFFVQSYGHENHFYWKATYPKMQKRSQWVERIEYYAARFVPGHEPLADEEIQNVVNRTQPLLEAATADGEKARRSESEKWTGFIINSFLVAIIVRALLGGLHFRRYHLYKNEFKPDPDDKFFEDMLEKVMAAGIANIEKGRSSETSDLPVGSPPPVDSALAEQATGPPKTLIFMYDLDVPKTIWQDFFPDGDNREIYSAEQCRGKDGGIVQRQINEGEIAVDRIILAFDITGNPAMDRLNFVRDTAGAVLEKTFVLLSRMEALRRQKNGDPMAIENRKMEWTVKLEKMGVPPENLIDYFDHEIDDAKTRKRLSAFFRGDREEFRLAGKYADASEIILAGVREIFDEYKKNPLSFASEQWDARPVIDDRLVSYREKISRLYAKEGKKLNVFIDRLASSVDVNEIKNVAADKMQQLGDQTVRESLAWGRWLNDVHQTLKPRCGLALVGIVPAALAGVTLGTAAAVLAGPLAALGIAGVAGGFFTPEAIGRLKKGGFRQEFLKASTTEVLSDSDETQTNFRIDVSAFIASLATWSVVHELQGLPPEQIAKRLASVLEPIETTSVNSPEIIRTAFVESRKILEMRTT